MDPDDPERELRFRYGPYHVVITVDPDGGGSARVVDHFYVEPPPDEKRKALAAALKMLSIARHLTFDAYVADGGTIEELNTQPVKKL